MNNQRSHHRFVALASLLVALALMFGVAASGFVLANASQSGIAKRRAELSHMRHQFARIAKHNRSATATRKKSANWDQLLLPVMSTGAAGAQLQGRLNTAASRAGARLVRARVEPQSGEHLLRRVTVSIAIEAKVKALRELLFALERDAPLTFVDRLDIARRAVSSRDGNGKMSDDDPQLAVSVQVSNYMRAEIINSEQ